MRVLEVLKSAREVIADESHWTQNDLAVDLLGRPVEVSHPEAIRWCSVGAMHKVVGENQTLVVLADEEFSKTCGALAAAIYNDSHSHAAVLMVFDETIRRLEAKVVNNNVVSSIEMEEEWDIERMLTPTNG